MEKLRYSITYAVIRPEITERVSIGLITAGGGKVDVKYSRKKLDALRHLFPQSKYQYLRKVVMSLSKNQAIGNLTKQTDTTYLSDHRHALLCIGSADSTFLSHKPSGCLRDDHPCFVNISTPKYPTFMPLCQLLCD